jgi:hypothetical protein
VARAAGFGALAKVTVQAKGRNIDAVQDLLHDAYILETLELGLSEAAFRRLEVAPGRGACRTCRGGETSTPSFMFAVRPGGDSSAPEWGTRPSAQQRQHRVLVPEWIGRVAVTR